MIPAEHAEKIAKHQESLPIDVAAIAKEFGIAVFSQSLAEGVSGVLVRDSQYRTASGFAIIVDRGEPAVRQRFTAAHELGHFLLHKESIGDRIEDNYLLRSNQLSNRQEIEANKFAADLLMPYNLIQAELERGATTPEELAERFGVSLTAMSIRLGLPT